MIPCILEIKNFLSYGPSVQRIDFTDHWLICLSGNNGHGKSALLDAMTWALWGQARKTGGTSKADEGLLHLGSTQMLVVFECICNGRRYRVRREFAKTYGKPYAALDFAVHDAEKDTYTSLTDKTIKATQQKIESTIGLDYDTFINSSFLRQGQANEFSKKSARERKQVLSTILGLGRYDKLQQAALEQARKSDNDCRLYAHQYTLYEQELAQEDTLRQSHKDLCQEYTQTQISIDTLQQLIATQEKNIAHATAREHQAALLAHALQETDQQLLELITQFNSIHHQWQTTHRQLLAIQDDASLEAQQRALLAEEHAMLAARTAYLEAHEKIVELKDALQTRRTQIQVQRDAHLATYRQAQEQHAIHVATAQEQYKLLYTRLEECTTQQTQVAAQIEQCQQELISARSTNNSLQATRQSFEKRKAFYQQLIHQGNSCKTAQNELEHKRTALSNPTNPSCPLCEQIVTNKRKQYLLAQLVGQEQFWQHRIARIASLLKKLKELLVEQNQTLTQGEQTTARIAQLEQHIAYLEQQKQKLDAQSTELQQAHTISMQTLDALAQHGQQLTHHYEQAQRQAPLVEQDPHYQTLLQEIATAEKSKAQHAFNPTQHQQLLIRKDALEKIRASRNQHNAMRSAQEERKALLAARSKQIKSMRIAREKTNSEVERLKLECAHLANLQQELHAHTRQRAVLLEQKENLAAQRAGLQQSLERLALVAKQAQEIKKQLQERELEVKDYQELGTMFGKNGIQALLIEEAIPEIEQEANGLLAQLTNNQAHISIESLRDLKSGGTRETLDIHIADSAGVRPYEMYSGGEAFRIDFALRIAISKLLARRAGTALQTLIIDEGFGSQDEEGLARILQALHSIQHEFAKIIIVSHLAEFKEHFPSHFIVQKGPSGSQVTTEHRG